MISDLKKLLIVLSMNIVQYFVCYVQYSTVQ